MYLKVRKEKDFFLQAGGNFSNRPISEGFLAGQYNYLSNFAMDASFNTYVGKLYASGQVKVRLDFPFSIPFYIEPNFTINRWDFFKSSAEFVQSDVKPPFLKQKERYFEGNIGLPIQNRTKMTVGSGFAEITDFYYQTDDFTQQDTADQTDFNVITSHLLLESNSLNRKQYASQGGYFAFRARFVQGEEFSQEGSTAEYPSKFRAIHEWIQGRIIWDKYFNRQSWFRIGVYFEGTYTHALNNSDLFFRNYTATILSSPAFQPIPESKTLFQENYRAHKFFASGIKIIAVLPYKTEFRIEGYAYQPYEQILRGPFGKAVYSEPFQNRYFIAMTSFIWHTPLGPASLSLNFYDKQKEQFTILFHFGYILFNRKALN